MLFAFAQTPTRPSCLVVRCGLKLSQTIAIRVAGAQVAAELQEPGPGLARLDVPVQLVLAQLIGGEQVPDPGGAGAGGADPWPRRPAGLFALAADRGLVPPRPWLQIQRPELNAEDHFRLAVLARLLPSAIAYSRSTRVFFDAFQVFSR